MSGKVAMTDEYINEDGPKKVFAAQKFQFQHEYFFQVFIFWYGIFYRQVLENLILLFFLSNFYVSLKKRRKTGN